MAESETATNKLKAQAKETELVPTEGRKAVTLLENWGEAEVRDRQGRQQVVR